MTVTEGKEAIQRFVLGNPTSTAGALILEDVLRRVERDCGAGPAEELAQWFKAEGLRRIVSGEASCSHTDN